MSMSGGTSCQSPSKSRSCPPKTRDIFLCKVRDWGVMMLVRRQRADHFQYMVIRHNLVAKPLFFKRKTLTNNRDSAEENKRLHEYLMSISDKARVRSVIMALIKTCINVIRAATKIYFKLK